MFKKLIGSLFVLLIVMIMSNISMGASLSDKLAKQVLKELRNDNLSKAIKVLDKGANVDYIDRKKRLLLHYAVCYDYKIVKSLIEKGSKINVFDYRNMTPLMYACDICDDSGFEIVKLLIEKGADINAKGGEHRGCETFRTPLHFVAMSGSFSRKMKKRIIKLLLKNGAILTKDWNDWYPQKYVEDDPELVSFFR